MKKFTDKKRRICMGAGIAAALGIGMAVSFFREQAVEGPSRETSDSRTFTYHVAMIGEDSSDVFWKSLYESARQAGMETDIYFQDFGAGLNEDCTSEELLEMAAASKVDGIVVESDETEETDQLIEKAVQANIPVITLMKDMPESDRISYVGASSFALGEMYGREIMKAAEKDGMRAIVLIPANESQNLPNYIYSGITQTIADASRDIQLSTVRTGEDSEFASEETIRDLLLDEERRPDVLVCQSTTDTMSAYQCVREYNLVGKVKIIGYYMSPEILEGIQAGVIQSVIVVDAREAGELCVKAMNEYLFQRYTSEYFPVTVGLINKENVGDYIDSESGEEK